MKANLKIEAIGHDSYQFMRSWSRLMDMPKPDYWVAMITGKYSGGYKLAYLVAKTDYKHANSVGSRGVYLHYILESGHIYQVSQPISWKRTRKYYCTVTDEGEIVEVNEEYVDQWIKDHWELMFLRQQSDG